MEYSNSTMFKLATKCVLKAVPCLFVVCLMCFHLLSIGIGSSEMLNNIKKKKKSFKIMQL